MADDQLAVVNSALRELGDPPVTDVTETANARDIVNAYDETRREMLRDYYWPFAIKRAQLVTSATALSTVEALEWDYAFDKPSDWIRTDMLSRSGDFRRDPIWEFDDEQNRILCNEDEAYIRYVFDQDDTTEFDATFDVAFALALASKTATQVTQSVSLGQRLEAMTQDRRFSARHKATTDKDRVTSLPGGRWRAGRHGRNSLSRNGSWRQFP